ncbi:MAG: GDP-mannose 4,6-dehydratase [Hydrococcus sp. C42_A2020_068]|uniref:NAD-dependent epimerase/dehydratase family protein n=1 Tax=Pleurocapsa sp. PCC 7327 TaxID=118163 RepID=UPI00029FC5C5|nr:NAD-dependent epimerase/dehydratase family protein [Pleurocapsa sp. PCC 7327]AFY78751.1 nucleoside-diphosphate-sugar epimerase [Pleurocapsa sp. PCC 7327]MBF2018543.1 GDP-mannose 4,6-dehydratase [Hydrococcus sp. C42_A2020_068]
MTTSIVTGVAGFIGSHLAEALLKQGERVIGIDEFNDYYEPSFKRRNISSLESYSSFELIEGSIHELNWQELLANAETLYHQAAQAGVRASWGESFRHYTERNINATQIILEAAKESKSLKRLVFASSSSIYGNAETLPTPESICPQPTSPYGITKLAAEYLCFLYYRNFQVPVTALRYFSVYGPRQRPDMAFHKFFKAAMVGAPIPIYGDGQQTRDFTFVSDVVAANLAAATVPDAIGEAFNIGGGSRVVLADMLDKIEAIAAIPIQRNYLETARGDARHTGADVSKAKALLGWSPKVSLIEGLTQQWEWIQTVY